MWAKGKGSFIVPNTTREHTITCLSSIFARYCYPIYLVSENPPQFISAEHKTCLTHHGVKDMLLDAQNRAAIDEAQAHIDILNCRLNVSVSESVTYFAKAVKQLPFFRTERCILLQ